MLYMHCSKLKPYIETYSVKVHISYLRLNVCILIQLNINWVDN